MFTTENNKLNKNSLAQQEKNFVLAQQAHNKGDFATAEKIYRQLISEGTKWPSAFSKLAILCTMSNRVNEAKYLWQQALALSDVHVEALVGLGDINKFERSFTNAISYYNKALKLNAKMPQAHLNISYSFMELRELDKSEQACREALKLSPNYVQAQEHLGQILVAKGELSRAIVVFNRLIKENNENINALYLLGDVLKSQGEFKNAEEYFQKAFTINPSYSVAHFTYSTIHKYLDQSDPHIALMETEYKKPNIHPENKMKLCFALAKAYEDINEHSCSFEYLAIGNQLKDHRYQYNIESDSAFFKSIIQSFTKELLSELKITPNMSDKPIFIVGMPRSGTTLVERILASHSKVHGAGELEDLFHLGTKNFLTQSSNFLYTPITGYPKDQLENIGHAYLNIINKLSANAEHVTDKLPFNMLMIGFIKAVFPNAKIIHCKREPIDTCLSIFKTNFASDNYRYAYNLKTLGQFYNLYLSLMEHWQSNFPEDIYEVDYDKLVAQPNDEIAKLVGACNLEWEDTCLHFDKLKTVVKTASVSQVRQPIYTRSSGLWKSYEEYLLPLINELNKPQPLL